MRQARSLNNRRTGASLAPLGVAVLVTLLSGCSEYDNSDLDRYIAEVKSRPAGRIDPIPEFKTYEIFPYSAENYRDPFIVSEAEGEIELPIDSGVKPDVSRNKETLEDYPLDTLKFVGNLERDGENWAIITSPDKIVHRVKAGNYLGTNYGKIVAVQEDRIEIVELVPDGLGGWIERKAALSLGQ